MLALAGVDTGGGLGFPDGALIGGLIYKICPGDADLRPLGL